MDLATIRTEIRERLGETTEEDFWKDSQILRAINEAMRRFAQEERWPWLYTTYTGAPALSAGNPTVELIDDVNVSRHFSLTFQKSGTNERIIVPRRIDPGAGIRLRHEYGDATGQPRYYYITHSIKNTYTSGDPMGMAVVIRVLPTPDVAYDIEYSYVRNPEELVADTDIADIPDNYVDAIISYATGNLWLKELNGGGKAQEQFNLYNIIVDQARKELAALSIGETLVWGRKPPEWQPRDMFPFVNLPPNIGI